MAKIVKYERGYGKIGSNITEVNCVYKVDVVSGERYISFSTYGSSDRKVPGSASQVLHFDKDSAMDMIKILKDGFDL